MTGENDGALLMTHPNEWGLNRLCSHCMNDTRVRFSRAGDFLKWANQKKYLVTVFRPRYMKRTHSKKCMYRIQLCLVQLFLSDQIYHFGVTCSTITSAFCVLHSQNILHHFHSELVACIAQVAKLSTPKHNLSLQTNCPSTDALLLPSVAWSQKTHLLERVEK